MPIDVHFAALRALVAEMDAPEVAWRSDVPELDRLSLERTLATTGQVFTSLGEVGVNSDGLLTYKGREVVVYIKDSGKTKDEALNDPEEGKRFHFADCRTLEKFRRNGRFDRYVRTTRRDGVFWVDVKSRGNEVEEIEARLFVCKNCLDRTDWQGYSLARHRERTAIRDKFDLEKLYRHYKPTFRSMPKYTEKTAPSSTYTDDWHEVSQRERAAAGWCCGNCKVDLSGHHYLLHTHHGNGVKGDNRPENLRVLCVACHSEVDEDHHHLKAQKASDIREVEEIRRESLFP